MGQGLLLFPFFRRRAHEPIQHVVLIAVPRAVELEGHVHLDTLPASTGAFDPAGKVPRERGLFGQVVHLGLQGGQIALERRHLLVEGVDLRLDLVEAPVDVLFQPVDRRQHGGDVGLGDRRLGARRRRRFALGLGQHGLRGGGHDGRQSERENRTATHGTTPG